MAPTAEDGRIRSLLQAELATVTGEAAGPFTDATLLTDIGIDSLDLVEVLLAVREQVLDDRGLSMDDLDDPPSLPWLETVGELVAFVESSIPAPSA